MPVKVKPREQWDEQFKKAKKEGHTPDKALLEGFKNSFDAPLAPRASYCPAMNYDLIVIGGGLSALGDLLLDPARQVFQSRALPGPAQCPIVTPKLGREASVIGAASLAMEAPALPAK